MLTVTLREKDGGERQQTFDQEEITLGRADGCDIVLPKNNVSKRHARLVDKQDRVVLVDLRSTNGTYVNGRRITAPEMIGPRDKVYIGDFVLTVECAGADDEESAVYSETIDAADILGGSDDPQVVFMNEDLLESAVENAEVGPTEAVGGEAAALQAAVAHVVEEGRDDEASDDGDAEQLLEGRTPADTEAVPPAEDASDDDEDAVAEASDDDDDDDDEDAVAEASDDDDEDDDDEASDDDEDAVAEVEASDDDDDDDDDDDAEVEASDDDDAVAEVEASHDEEGTPLDERGLMGLMDQPDVRGVWASSHEHMVVERVGGSQTVKGAFPSTEAFEEEAARLASALGHDVDMVPPVVEGALSDETSAALVLEPLAATGPLISLRRSSLQPVGEEQLGAAASALRDAVEAGKGFLICGDHASDRSAVAAALVAMAPEQERIVVVSQRAGAQVSHPNAVVLDKSVLEGHGEEILELAPRLDADRVVMDPLSAADLFGFIALGLSHPGGHIGTVRGTSSREVIQRLALQLELALGARLDERAREMVAAVVDLIVVVGHGEQGSEITEVVAVKPDGEVSKIG